jgi:hypothetical protein
MKKKTIIKIESILLLTLVIVTVFQVTNAVAISYGERFQKMNTNKGLIGEKKGSINPKINLTKKTLPLLMNAIRRIDNGPIKQVEQEIINLLNKKDFVNSQDLKKILTNLNISTMDISCGFIDVISTTGLIVTFPGFLLELCPGLYIGPALVALWIPGCAIGFFGSCENVQRVEHGYSELRGFCCLAIGDLA